MTIFRIEQSNLKMIDSFVHPAFCRGAEICLFKPERVDHFCLILIPNTQVWQLWTACSARKKLDEPLLHAYRWKFAHVISALTTFCMSELLTEPSTSIGRHLIWSTRTITWSLYYHNRRRWSLYWQQLKRRAYRIQFFSFRILISWDKITLLGISIIYCLNDKF